MMTVSKNSTFLNKNIFILTLISLLNFVTTASITSDISFFIFNTVILIFAVGSYAVRKKCSEHFLFFLFFNIYTLLSIFVYYTQLVQFGMPAAFADEPGFFAVSYAFINDTPPSWANVGYLEILHRIDWVGYQLLISSLGWIFDIINVNSLIALKQVSVLFGALSVAYTYKLFFYFLQDGKQSFSLAFFFGLVPYVAMYSSVLLRDIIILFLTVYTIVHMVYFISGFKASLLKLSVGVLLLFFFRPENGLFMAGVVIVSFIVFNWIKISFIAKIIYLIILMIICALFFNMIYDEVAFRAFFVIQNSSERALEHASESSLGKYLLLLPFPFDSIARAFFSQIQPFPVWGRMQYNFALIVEMFAGVIWFPIFILSIVTLSVKKYRVFISKEIKLLYFFALLYILLIATGEANPRRLMAFYPIILLVAYLGYSRFSKVLKKQYLFILFFSMFLLHFIYLYIKY